MLSERTSSEVQVLRRIMLTTKEQHLVCHQSSYTMTTSPKIGLSIASSRVAQRHLVGEVVYTYRKEIEDVSC